MDIIKNIVTIRKEKDISQEYIANILQVDTSAISNIENGKRELKVSELGKIVKALDVDILYLLTYPYTYVKREPGKPEPVDTIFQLRLTGEKREKVLKLVFGDRNLEFLNE